MEQKLIVTMVYLAISATLNFALVIGWFRASRRASRYEKRFFAAPVTDDRRVDQLESALDAVAGQVDQLASGQDFLSRVVGERGVRLPERPQVVTPH